MKLIAFINVLNLLVQLCRGSESNCKRIGSIPGALHGLVGLAAEKFIIREKNEELAAEEKQNFSTTIKKKARFLLYMMWCAKSARKTYLKHGFKIYFKKTTNQFAKTGTLLKIFSPGNLILYGILEMAQKYDEFYFYIYLFLKFHCLKINDFLTFIYSILNTLNDF